MSSGHCFVVANTLFKMLKLKGNNMGTICKNFKKMADCSKLILLSVLAFACLVAIASLWPIFDQIGFLMQTRVHSQGAISQKITSICYK